MHTFLSENFQGTRSPQKRECLGSCFSQFFVLHFFTLEVTKDRHCGLVVRVSGYRYRGFGFDSRRYQIF